MRGTRDGSAMESPEGRLDAAAPARDYERRLAADRVARRGAGAFYTPEYLVDFTVAETLAARVAGRGLEEILRLRVCDPACGGGAFLLGALRFLERAAIAAGGQGGPALRRRIAESCLVGVDVDAGALAVCRESLAIACGGPMDVELYCADALDIALELGGLDAIVGNPPWGQKGIAIDAATRRRYRESYRCSRGPLDPFKLFVERTHALLAPGGRWGLVLPDIVLLKNHQDVRDLILEQSAIDLIAHAGRAFPGVNLDACVLIGERVAVPAPDHRVRIWHSVPESWRDAPPPERAQRQGVFAELAGHRFNLHIDDGDLALLRRLAPLPRLGELFEIHEGVHSGNARAKLFRPSREHPSFRKLIVGRGELQRFKLDWAGAWLDPRPESLDRAAGDYANLGRPDWHSDRKLVVRRTGDRVIAAYDPSGHAVSNNLFVLLPRADKEDRELRAIAAILNSALITWCFRSAVPRVGKLFAELKITHLGDFPVPAAPHWNDGVIDELSTLYDLGARDGAAAVAPAVDAVVESLYEISPAERAVINMRQ